MKQKQKQKCLSQCEFIESVENTCYKQCMQQYQQDQYHVVRVVG